MAHNYIPGRTLLIHSFARDQSCGCIFFVFRCFPLWSLRKFYKIFSRGLSAECSNRIRVTTHGHTCGKDFMSTLFLIVCVVGLLFFAVFLFECLTQSRRRPAPQPAVHKVAQSEAVDSAAGRRFFVHMEKEMAEFLLHHGRTTVVMLLGVALLPVILRAQTQPAQADGAPAGGADQAVPPAVQKQLDAMQKRIEMLEAELSARAPEGTTLTSKASAPAHVTGDQAAPSVAPAEGSLQAVAASGKPEKPAPFSLPISVG